jgi:hypothetical protein
MAAATDLNYGRYHPARAIIEDLQLKYQILVDYQAAHKALF